MIDNRLQRFYRRHFVLTEWNIGVVAASPENLHKLVTRGELGAVRWGARSSALQSRADPFFWPLEAGTRVIYEEIDHRQRRGHIRSLPLEGLMSRQDGRVEIVQPFHLSYPFIFGWEGKWYCIPESARGGGLDLYLWDGASGVWVLQRRLLDDIEVLDATLFRHEQRWYVFGTLRGNGAYEKLRIWWADSLMGEWRVHGMSAAKVDLGSARPAGALFEFNGAWYRPAQDCQGGYGRALTINRIELLTPTQFSETTVSRIKPVADGPYPDGLHTLGVLGDTILIDGKKVGFSVALPVMKLRRRCERFFKRHEGRKQYS